MPKNLSGNRLSQANSISGTTSFSDRVSRQNPVDLYSFNLSQASGFNLRFRSSGRGANLKLIQDRNQNSLVDAGEVLQSTTMRPQERAMNVSQLDPGTYFLQVSTTAKGNNNYRLNLTSTPSGTSTQLQANTESSPSMIDQVVLLTNNFRRQNGLLPLTVNPLLNAAAQSQSQNMALQDYFDHTAPDGSTPGQRVTATGYRWSRVAENIGAGYSTADAVVEGWINSPGHRANMLDPNVTEIGIGYYFLPNDTGNQNWNYYWTQEFGKQM
jgi:uncharacterized protein YkwD